MRQGRRAEDICPNQIGPRRDGFGLNFCHFTHACVVNERPGDALRLARERWNWMLRRWLKGWPLSITFWLHHQRKSEAWKSFDHVHNEVDESVGYVKCKKCGVLLKYESKTTGNSSLIRHAHRSCSTPAMVPNNHAYKGSQSSLYRLMLPLLFY